MTISFRPAVRANVNLLIGLAGGTGSGKTFSAMRMAAGIAGDAPFAVIDTERGRASHYADRFKFDVAEMEAPFSPELYAEAIEAADKAGYPVIVVDSMSHEYAGDGGVLDMQEAEFQRMGGRDGVKMASWIKPKLAHKHMVSRILQTRAHLILCFRAEPKIEIIKQDGKTVIVPKQSLVGLDGWLPVTEKNLPFELTVSFLMTADKPGIPKPIKLQDQHRPMFPLDQPVTEESGRAVAAWATGGETPKPPSFAALIAASTSMEQLREIKRTMVAMKATIPAVDQESLRAALAAKQASFEPPAETSEAPTAEFVKGKLESAHKKRDLDMLHAHADMIRLVDEAQRPALSALYAQFRDEMAEAA